MRLLSILLLFACVPVSAGEVTRTLTLEWIDNPQDPQRTQEAGITFRSGPVKRYGNWSFVTFDRLWYRETGERRSWPDYDSAETDALPPVHLPYEGTAFAAVLGQTLHFEVDDAGKIKTIDNWEPAFDAMIASFRSEETVSDDEVATKRGEFVDYLKRAIFHTLTDHGKGEYALGERWQSSRPSEQGTVTTEYTVESVDDVHAVVSLSGTVRGYGGSPGSQSGRLVIDRYTRSLVRLELDQKTSGRGTFLHRVRLATD